MNNIDQQQLAFFLSCGGVVMSIISICFYFSVETIYDITLAMLPRDEKARKMLLVSDRKFTIKFGKILSTIFFLTGIVILFSSKFIVKYTY